MKLAFTSFFVVLSLALFSQTYQLTVANGYGSGAYRAGDSVHIFSNPPTATTVFNQWTGDISPIQDASEWHSVVVMPARNISISAESKASAAVGIPVLEQIRGKNILKPVYSAFPSGMRGVIFLLHGSGGSAQNWVTQFENLSFVRDALADNFGVIITECEESTLNQDTNGDGKIRWATFPADTLNNVDYVNIRAIRDTFIQRGKFNYATPLFSVGMSAGAAYSATLSPIYRFKAGVNYCAPSANLTIALTQTPTMFNMALYDMNENVGPQGNADALQNFQTLQTRGICSRFSAHDRTPLYAERFSRRGDLSVALSTTVFNELKTTGFLDVKNYAKTPSDSLIAHLLATPSVYPTLVSLTAIQRAFVFSQIDVSFADHQFYSDYNKRTLRFLKNQCAPTTPTIEILENQPLRISPNPTADFIRFEVKTSELADISFVDLAGKQVFYSEKNTADGEQIYVGHLPNGLYLVRVRLANGAVWIGKLVVSK